jgi:uncharacterized Zn finger protein
MIELKSREQLSSAIERAKAGRLFVQTTAIFRQYVVTNRQTGTEYTVNFFVRSGRRFAACTCKGAQGRHACKHVAAAAALHLYIAAQARRGY